MAPAVVRAINLVAAAWPPEEQVGVGAVRFSTGNCSRPTQAIGLDLQTIGGHLLAWHCNGT